MSEAQMRQQLSKAFAVICNVDTLLTWPLLPQEMRALVHGQVKHYIDDYKKQLDKEIYQEVFHGDDVREDDGAPGGSGRRPGR